MFGKLMDILALFRKGNEVANASIWKDGGNAATVLVPLMMAAVKVAGDFGYGIQLSTDEATQIALGVVAVIQFIVHNVTSKRAGLLPAKPITTTVSETQATETTEKPVQPVSQANAGSSQGNDATYTGG